MRYFDNLSSLSSVLDFSFHIILLFLSTSDHKYMFDFYLIRLFFSGQLCKYIMYWNDLLWLDPIKIYFSSEPTEIRLGWFMTLCSSSNTELEQTYLLCSCWLPKRTDTYLQRQKNYAPSLHFNLVVGKIEHSKSLFAFWCDFWFATWCTK